MDKILIGYKDIDKYNLFQEHRFNVLKIIEEDKRISYQKKYMLYKYAYDLEKYLNYLFAKILQDEFDQK